MDLVGLRCMKSKCKSIYEARFLVTAALMMIILPDDIHLWILPTHHTYLESASNQVQRIEYHACILITPNIFQIIPVGNNNPIQVYHNALQMNNSDNTQGLMEMKRE